jgi:hypothetical protein
MAAASVYGLPDNPFTQDAEASHCDDGVGRCMFPTEAHRGGIVLGVGRLSGQGATTFNVGGAPGAYLPPGRSATTDESVPLGINNLDPADNFFLYKTWKYDDTSVSPNEANADVYIWIGTTTANLVTESRTTAGEARDPSATCGGGNGFRDGCDLLAYSGEISAGEFNVREATINAGIDFTVSPTAQGYWVDDPEQDTCTGVDFSGIQICLSLIEDGSLTGSVLKSIDLVLYNFMTSTHYAQAVQSPANQGGTTEYDKLLTIEDGYLEIRHGKGNDRSRVLDATNPGFGAADWQQPAERAGDETFKHGVGQGFDCEGGPDGDQDCSPGQKPTGGTEADGSSDDIHR